MTARRFPAFGALAVSAAALFTFATALPAGAVTVVAVSNSCTGTALGITQTTTENDHLDVTAPTSVPSGGWFDVFIGFEQQTAPSTIGSFTVLRIKDVMWKFTITNATLKGGPILSGGSSNLGATSVRASGNVVTVSASGPISGGQSFTLPGIDLSLTAGAAGMPATVSLTGTDLTFTAVVRSGSFTINVPVTCVPKPDPTILSSTNVT